MTSVFSEGPIIVSAINITHELLCVVLTAIRVWGVYRDAQKVDIRSPLSHLLLLNGEWCDGV